jgi:ZIP family zinc transporter/zinc and cadmium transporter
MLRPAAGWLAVIGLGVHTLFDGVAIAAGYMVSPTLGGLLFLAVLVHKVPEGFTIASLLLAGGHSRATAIAAGGALGLLTLGGAGRDVGGQLDRQHLDRDDAVQLIVERLQHLNREGGPALAWTVFAGLLFFIGADWLLSAFASH